MVVTMIFLPDDRDFLNCSEFLSMVWTTPCTFSKLLTVS